MIHSIQIVAVRISAMGAYGATAITDLGLKNEARKNFEAPAKVFA